MKLGVVSDSHGNLRALTKALEQMGAVDEIFHLGDYVEDAVCMKELTDVPIHVIRGNMDEHEKEGSKELLTTIEGVEFLACHGHHYNVKWDLEALYYSGLKKNVQVILFGHTHKPFIDGEEGILVMNPGSIGAPRMGNPPSYGIITIKDGKVYGEIVLM